MKYTIEQKREIAAFLGESAFSVVLCNSKDGIEVETSCLYPNMTPVHVYISFRENYLLVSDGRQGLMEVLSFGVTHSKPGEWLAKYASVWGVDYSSAGRVSTKVLAPEGLPQAIMQVANASRDGVVRAVENARFAEGIPYSVTFANHIEQRYKGQFKSMHLIGKTAVKRRYNYVHTDEYPEDNSPVILKSGVVIDSVEPSEKSILFKVHHHRLIADLGNKNVSTFLVRDENDDHWTDALLHTLTRDKLPVLTRTEFENSPPSTLVQLRVQG
jgi:hypothetical protein